MNISSFDGYIISYIMLPLANLPEGYILWHVELFRCHVNGYIPCYATLKSSATPPPPQISLSADLQQVESKAYLFTHCQAGQAPQHLCQCGVLLASGCALVVVGYGLLFCLLPVRGLKVGNIRRPWRCPRPPSTSMSSGLGDGEAKSEVEELLLRWRLHGVEGFGLSGSRTKWLLHESRKAFCTRETNSLQAAR